MNAVRITFGDTVRVRSTSVTEEAGFAGLTGQVYGETIPSSSGVDEIIGDRPECDYAINVYFENSGENRWFQEELLEFIDHGVGTVARLDGADSEWIRNERGEWIEHPLDGPKGANRPWWKFWRRG